MGGRDNMLQFIYGIYLALCAMRGLDFVGKAGIPYRSMLSSPYHILNHISVILEYMVTVLLQPGASIGRMSINLYQYGKTDLGI